MSIHVPQSVAVTLEMIAVRCGVHRSTVHRALNNKGRVDPVTAAHIRAVAEEMGYNPAHHQAASRLIALRHGNRVINRMVALFLPTVFYRHNYYLRILRGLLEVLVAERFDLMTTYLTAKPGPLPHSIVAGNVDGVISVAAPDLFGDPLAALRATPYFGARPVVSLLHPLPGCSLVLTDDRAGAYAACAHLLDLGHRRLLYLFIDAGGYISQQRIAGYQQACRDHGVDPAAVLHPISIDWNPPVEERITRGVAAAIHRVPQATAILAPNDLYAIQIREALRLAGRRVPEDYSLTGFDDTDPLPDDTGMNILTTVSLPLEEIGRTGARLIVRQILDDVSVDDTLTLPATLVPRNSTTPPHR
ncbi:MAG: LacI family DNA-binding transcriptional regulator [Armatimonadota bacterium]